MATLKDELKKWVVNDYFTPNIKAEVILDTLLTPYIPQIVKRGLDRQAGELRFLAKEMPIEEFKEKGNTDDRGAKIDYVLESTENCVYLVELKTTKGSIDNDQITRYIKNCYGKQFGPAVGDKLLRILKKRFPKVDIENLDGAFWGSAGGRGHYAERAMGYLKQAGLDSTAKYLYTLGQVLDNSPNTSKLWRKELRLVYLTPDGGNVFPSCPRKKDKQEPARTVQEWKELQRQWDRFSSGVSLAEAKTYLSEKKGDELAQLLAEIIGEIYGG